MAAVGLNDNLRVQTGKHLDEKYGGVGTDIYPDVATALSSVAAFERVKGLTVAVDDGSGGAIEYWFEGGVADVDLVDKTASASYWVKTGVNLAYTLGTVSIGDNKIIDVAAGTVATDGVNLEQVQNLVDGVDWKDSAELATTGNITLSGEQTIDGVLTSTSRVFVWQQSDATENGIYTTGSGGWTRTTDASTGEEIVSMRIPIGSGGSTLANNIYINTNTSITLGSTNITFIVNPSVVAHNSTTGKQGGATDEYYHLTSAQHSALTDANAQLSALHTDGDPTFNDVTATGTVTGSNLSGNNTGDQDLSGYLLNTTDEFTGTLTVTGAIDTTGNLTLSGNTNKQIQMTSLTAFNYFLSSESNDFTINDGTDDFIELIYDATATDKKISLMDGTLTLTKGGTAILSILVGGGNKIAYADNDGIIRQMAYGSGLAFDGITLTATGGSAGSVTTQNDFTSNYIPYATGAANLEDSIISQTSTTAINITGQSLLIRNDLAGDTYLFTDRSSSSTDAYNGWILRSSSLANEWTLGQAGDGSEFRFYNYGTASSALTIDKSNNNLKSFGSAIQVGSGTSAYLQSSLSGEQLLAGESSSGFYLAAGNGINATKPIIIGSSNDVTTTIAGKVNIGVGSVETSHRLYVDGDSYFKGSSTVIAPEVSANREWLVKGGISASNQFGLYNATTANTNQFTGGLAGYTTIADTPSLNVNAFLNSGTNVSTSNKGAMQFGAILSNTATPSDVINATYDVIAENKRPWLFTFVNGTSSNEMFKIGNNGNVWAKSMKVQGQYNLTSMNTAPSSASSTGTLGEIRWVNGYVYLCVSTNTWKRASLSTWS